MASIGTAGVPSVGLITLTMVFNSVGLPVQAIGMIFGIDHILDMFRTAVNVTGDAICTLIVSFKNKSLDVDVFNGNKERDPSNTVLLNDYNLNSYILILFFFRYGLQRFRESFPLPA